MSIRHGVYCPSRFSVDVLRMAHRVMVEIAFGVVVYSSNILSPDFEQA